jgi:PAS domain S-box-containing protein
MTEKKINLLIIDDDDVDSMAIKRAIKSSGFNAELTLVDAYDLGMEQAITKEFDALIIDYHLQGLTAMDFIEEFHQRGGATPIVIISSQGDEKIIVDLMKRGASDYLPKASITPENIARSIKTALKSNDSKKERNHIEHDLVKAEQTLNAVVEKSSLIVFSINESGVFTLFKGKTLDVMQLSEQDIIGKSVFEIWNKLPVRLKDVKKALLGEEFKELIAFEGRFFESHYIPARNNDGVLTGVMGIATDITGHKEQEDQLRQQVILSSETQKIKEQFLANMSHEIRTPIHGIIGITKIVLQSNPDKELLHYLNAIRKSADNLLVIINDILDFSKIEAEKMTFESVCFNLFELVNTINELFKARISDDKVKIVLEMDPELPPLIKGDPVRLTQVINNLMGNAVKFTHQGSVTLSVSKHKLMGEEAIISFQVKDTGIGIAEDKLSTIFDSFSQAGSDITRKYGGTGLGLSIAKRIVELQEGNITVESKINEGTTFYFTLPFQLPGKDEQETEEKRVVDAHLDFKGSIKLLVVEDNEINRLIINKHIKDWGFEHEEACNGVEAVEMITLNEYDVVLMDIEMPEMNGYIAAEKVRTTLSGKKQQIPILAMTAHASSTEKAKCLSAGMNDYVSKPFDPIEVKNKIIELSGKKSVSLSSHMPVATPVSIAEVNTIPHAKLTDLSFLREMSGGTNDTFMREFIGLFITNMPVAITELEDGLQHKDWEKVRQSAHKMKPSLNYVGLKETYELVANIEKFAKDKVNLDELPALIKKVSDHCNIACIELEQDLKTVVV